MLTIQNEYLRLTVDPHGAQMMELATAKGTQLLWNGDENTGRTARRSCSRSSGG